MISFALAALKSRTAWKIAAGFGLALAAWWFISGWVDGIKAKADAAGFDRGMAVAAKVQATLDLERGEWAVERAKAAEAALKASEDARAEEFRRAAAHQEAIRAHQAQIARLRAAADIAATADLRLRERIATLAAQAGGGGQDPDPAGSGPAAEDPIGVLADVLGRCSARVRLLAAVADERGAAGEACVRAYEALTGPE